MRRSAIAEKQSVPRRFASMTRLEHDPRRALQRLGIRADAKQLDALVKEIQGERYRGLREGATTETAASLAVAASLMVERLIDSLAEIPPSSLPAAIKSICQACELLGGAESAYSAFNLTLLGPET